jgi:hypothetical protein
MKVMTKTIASLFFAIAGATAVMAQDPLPAQLGACLQITGLLQRLACYDRVAHAVAPRNVPAQRPVAQPAPPIANAAPVPPVAYAPPPVAAQPPTGLGSERLPRAASAKRAQELIAGVAGISYDSRGRFTVTLDNGQVWRQLEGDAAVLTGSRLSTVRISRGALGSYDLNVVGRNASYRVVRLQ